MAQRIDKTPAERKLRLPGRLEQVRKHFGKNGMPLSQRAFARKVGCFQQNVNRYELGTTPHADFFQTLALMGISTDWLLIGRGKMLARRA